MVGEPMFYVQSFVDGAWVGEQFKASQGTDYATAIAVAHELFWYHCVNSQVIDIDGFIYAEFNPDTYSENDCCCSDCD